MGDEYEFSVEEFAAQLGGTATKDFSGELTPEEFAAGLQDVMPGKPSAIRSAVGGLLGGTAGVIDAFEAIGSALAPGGGILAGRSAPKDNPLADLSANVRGAQQMVAPPEERGRGNMFTEGVPETLGQMVPGVVAGAINPAAGAAVFGAQSGGPAYFEVVGAGGSPEEGMLALVGNAGLAQLERLGAGGAFTQALKKLGGSKLGAKAISNIAAHIAVGGTKEVGTETLEQIGHDLIHAGLTGEEVAILDNALATITSPTVWTVGALGAGAEAAAGRQAPQGSQNAPGAKQPTRMAAQRPTGPTPAEQARMAVPLEATGDLAAPASPGLPSGEVPQLTAGESEILPDATAAALPMAAEAALPAQLGPERPVAEPLVDSHQAQTAVAQAASNIPGPAPEAPAAQPKSRRDELAGRKPHELTYAEAEEALALEREHVKNADVAALGEAGAKEWRKLQRQVNSSSDDVSTRALRRIHELEAGFTPEQNRLLYGIGEAGMNEETLKSLSRALGDVRSAKDEAELGRIVGLSLVNASDVNPDTVEPSSREALALAKLAEAKRVIEERGFDSEAVTRAALGRAQEVYGDDAPEMLRRWMPSAPGKPLPTQPFGIPEELPAAETPPAAPAAQPAPAAKKSWGNGELQKPKAERGDRFVFERDDGAIFDRLYHQSVTPSRMDRADAEALAARLNASRLNENDASVPDLSFSGETYSFSQEAKPTPAAEVPKQEPAKPTPPTPAPEVKPDAPIPETQADSGGTPPPKKPSGGVTEMFAGGPNPFGKFSNTSTAKIKKWAKKWLTSAGDKPRDVRREMELAEGSAKSELIEVGRHAKRLDAAMRGVDKNWRATETAERVDAAFEGDKAALASLPEEAQAAVADMRAQLDRVIRSQVKAGGVIDPKEAPAFAKKILESQGSYSRRSYKAYLDPEWADKVPADVRQRTHDLFRSWEEYAGATDAEIEAELDSILQKAKESTDNPWKAIAAGKLGRKDLSLYKRRKDIPAELRAFLGEVKDPIANYATSVFKIAQNVARHEASVNIRKMGLGKFLFEKPTGDATAKLTADGNKGLASLDGLYVTPELKAALVEIGPGELPAIIKAAARVNGAIKWGKVIGQPWAFMRNLWGNVPMSIANGHLPTYFKSKEWKAAFGEGDLDTLKRLKRLGIIDDNISTYEWEDAKRAAKATPDEIAKGVLAPGPAGQAIRGAERLFQAADNAPKIRFFFAEEAALVEAGYSPAKAESLAADRTRDLMPTPERMPEALKRFRRQPFLGTFFAFRAEVVRTTANRVRLISEELKSSNPKVRAMGQRRAAGQLVAATMTPALAYAVNMLNGVDSEEDEDKRNFLPPWDKNSRVVWFGDEAEGEYFDLSDLDPFTMGSDPIMRVLAGADPEKATESFVREELEAFVGPSIITQLAIDVSTGKDRDGKPIDDMTEHALKKIEPGIASSARRVPETGVAGEVGAAFTGVRRYQFDVRKSLSKDTQRYARLQAEAKSKEGRQSKRDPDDKKQNVEALEQSRKEAFDEIAEKAQAALRLGLSTQEVRLILREVVSAADVNAIISGNYRPHKDTKKALRE